MTIKWNEYTWYSKLAALIFFVLVLPAWTFYIGTRYEESTNIPTVAMHTIAANPADAVETIVASPSDYVGWKTYSDQKIGYTLKYPAGWYTIDNGQGVLISNYSDSYMKKFRETHGDLDLPENYFEMSTQISPFAAGSSLGDFLAIDVPTPAEQTMDIVKKNPIVVNGAIGIRVTQLKLTGIGDNTKENNTSIYVAIPKTASLVSVGYGWNDGEENTAEVAIGKKIVASLAIATSTAN